MRTSCQREVERVKEAMRNACELEVLAVNALDEPIDASPVAVGKTLYLRSESTLFAIE